jgi:hypothetical protein
MDQQENQVKKVGRPPRPRTSEEIEKENQPKRKPGRPAKIHDQAYIDTLRGTAREFALRTRGEALDRELEVLLPVLRQQVRQLPEQDPEGKPGLDSGHYWCVPPWLECGQDILRADAYGKVPIDFVADEEELDDDRRKSWIERTYADSYIDALAAEFALSRATRFHLSPDLVQFTIRVIEAALHFGRDLPGAAFHDKEKLVQYLNELKADGETYREPVKPRGKPGPKPRPPQVIEHAGPAAHVTNADPDFSKKIADMAQEPG